ncbi:hypothetical protein HJC23_007421 [Cyclotella cryptica]|uniref:Uncharacterized protein n=1 Tax=Cyclotella cryptica TaxID=29204 RepID=A0ABD3QJ15_9STRA|eukprot:CCRYP_005161-RA/>CCRYP_005161-RA protein AED:0.38 eAED:0.38 QI:0/-1/1/1/-1/1/1/130/208
MKSNAHVPTRATLALLLVNILNIPTGTESFAPHPLTIGNVYQRATHTAHPPHKNYYLEQLAAIPTKEEVSESSSSPVETPATTDMEINGGETVEKKEDEKELSETQKLLQKVKQAGTAGAISYALWELGFWGISIPVCIFGYREVTGHWPDLTNSEDLQKVGAEAFAFVNFARLAVPLRIGLALSTTGWIDENVVQKFMKKDKEEGSG